MSTSSGFGPLCILGWQFCLVDARFSFHGVHCCVRKAVFMFSYPLAAEKFLVGCSNSTGHPNKMLQAPTPTCATIWFHGANLYVLARSLKCNTMSSARIPFHALHHTLSKDAVR